MALLWDFSMVIPWLLSMAIGFGFTLWAYGLACGMSHWPFHSILLWVRHWAVCPSAFYGIALVHLIVTSMESLLWVAHWDDPTMGTPWHCFGSSQWCFHGCCLWLLDLGSPYGPSMELHVGLLIGHAMAFFYG